MTAVVKTTVSVSDELYRKADAAAANRGLNRSQFYAEALASHLRELEDEAVTAEIDAALDLAGEDDMEEWTEAAGRATFGRPG
ncbi:MAG TPA: hypothetical protein VHT30_09655 [Acidimicrobiales bacterium]|jgi:metal-responsive CopG/Arc/MetJ family transcriptional regulator|nr:hypothetical protein [Acidimicrobiales bacterium]